VGGAVTPLRVGVVGAGQISGAYLSTLRRLSNVEVVAVGDLDEARAAAAAAAAPGTRPLAVADLIAAKDVDLVLNLTIPAAHAEVARAAIAAGKHVYGEKPLTVTTGQAREVLTAATRAGVRVGCAPDTVLGTGVQTARARLDAGEIGAPVAATAFMVTPGHERWHPAPDFYYQPGGGPLFDMGPYYLTALVTLLGPVQRVTGMAATPRATRTIGSGPRAGAQIDVAVATHVTGVLEHASGALSTLMMSFDVWAARLPYIEVYGTAGSLSVPDPNGFGGTVQVLSAGSRDWTPAAEAGGYRKAARGYGVSDLASALASGTPHRASGEIAYHVLDIMETLLRAAESHQAEDVTSSCDRPSAVPFGSTPDDPGARLGPCLS
jgi:predicted dehydrogenase